MTTELALLAITLDNQNVMFDGLIEKKEKNQRLTYGEGVYWMNMLYRSEHGTANYNENHANLKKMIERHDADVKAAKEKNFPNNMVESLISNKMDFSVNGEVPQRIQVGIDIVESSEEEKQKFAAITGLSTEQAQTAIDILKEKKDNILRCSVFQLAYDSFRANVLKSQKAKVQMNAGLDRHSQHYAND